MYATLKYLQKATTLKAWLEASQTNRPASQLVNIPAPLTVRVQLTTYIRHWYEKYPNEEKEFTARRGGWWCGGRRCAMATVSRWGGWHHCGLWSGLWLRNYFRSRTRILSSNSFARNFRLLNILRIEFSLLLTVYTDMISSSFLSSLIKFSFIPRLLPSPPHIQSSAMIPIIRVILCCWCCCCCSSCLHKEGRLVRNAKLNRKTENKRKKIENMNRWKDVRLSHRDLSKGEILLRSSGS